MSGVLDFGVQKFLDLLSPELAAAIEAVEHLYTYPEGRSIFAAGDEADSLLIVRSGAVRLTTLKPSGRETIMGVLGQGHCVGIINVLLGRKRAHNAIALGETSIGQVRKPDLLALMEAYPEFANVALPVTLSRLRIVLKMMDDMRLLPLPAYIAVFIQYNLDMSDGPQVLHINQSDLALGVGASRVSVGKALKLLEAEGLITLKYGSIEIRDMQVLSDWIDQARAEQLSL